MHRQRGAPGKGFRNAKHTIWLPTALGLLALTSILGIWSATPEIAHATTETFTTPGDTSWTPPAGVTSVVVSCWGGGGGGAGGNSAGGGRGGGGGGGAAYASGTFTVSDASTYTVRI